MLYRAVAERAPSGSRRRAMCSPASIGRSEMLGWPNLKNGEQRLSTRRLFASWITIPQFCGNCRFVESCRGGCPSRRLLRGGLDLPDEFCPFAAGKPAAFVRQPRRKLATIPESWERLHYRVRCARAWGAQRLSNSKLPALDAALVLAILRVTLGALFVSTFFENLGKELYSAKGYAGLIRYYIQDGHAPAVWKQVMGFIAAHTAIAGPVQGVFEASVGVLLILGFLLPTCRAGRIRISDWAVGLRVGNRLDMGAAGSNGVAAALALGPSGKRAAVDVALARRWPQLPI